MPTYEYRCPKGHEFELFQRISDEPGADCPECGEAAQRLISAGAGFLFKGDGFYITDHRSDDYKKRASSESGAGTEGDAGGAGTNGDAGGAGNGGGGSVAPASPGDTSSGASRSTSTDTD